MSLIGYLDEFGGVEKSLWAFINLSIFSGPLSQILRVTLDDCMVFKHFQGFSQSKCFVLLMKDVDLSYEHYLGRICCCFALHWVYSYQAHSNNL